MQNTLKRRKNLRLPYFDYSQQGCYFVTICTKDRKMIFGNVIDREMKLNNVGNMLENTLLSVLSDYPNSEITEYIIMPNHLHFIWFNQDNAHLSVVVKKIKGRMTTLYREYHKRYLLHYQPLWQRGYYEHIIRDDKDYERIAEYIENNPLQWHLDRFYET